MNRKYIPIIGTVSAGKSTFLNSFLGINMLQIGATTTTKFVCLIKHSNIISFYHVKPISGKCIEFEKVGEETKDKEQIRKRIEKINEEFTNKKPTKEIYFICLKFQLKTLIMNNY